MMGTERGSMSESIERFRIRVDDLVLEDLQTRLARTRLPDQIDGTGWDGGMPIDYLRRPGRVLARHRTTGGRRRPG